MIILTCSLMAEARPLIDFFNLKQCKTAPFIIFENDKIRLIVSGSGKIFAAAATSYACAITKDIEGILHIGLAGHSELEKGTFAIANKIIDTGSSKSYYPSFGQESSFLTKCVITCDFFQKNYQEDALYDMEAAGFIATASKFATCEQIQCVKIVSHNNSHFAMEKEIPMLMDPHVGSIEQVMGSFAIKPQEKKEFIPLKKQKLKDILEDIKALKNSDEIEQKISF